MNKMTISIQSLHSINIDPEYIAYRDSFVVYNGFRISQFLEKYYGLLYINTLVYAIVDESKFTLFQLKYPECIKKIAYE
jgi:hypothetical protein